jgi:hypothetical protein
MKYYCLISLLCSSLVNAATDLRHEVILSATHGAMTFTDSNMYAGLTAGYNYSVHLNWQLGLFHSFSINHQTDYTNYFIGASVGPTFNLSEDLTNSFFIRTTVGISYGRSTYYSDTTFGVDALVGKRFAIFQSVYYTPSIGVHRSFGIGRHTEFNFNVLALSALF